MKKVLKILLFLLLFLIAAYAVLLIPPVDRWLTEKAKNLSIQNTGRTYIIREEDWELPNPDTYLTYLKNQRLFLLQEGTSIDITPPDVSIDAGENAEAIPAALRQKRNSQVSPNGTCFYYLLPQDDTQTLYCANLETHQVTKQASRVDSFLVLSDGSLLLACGYQYANSLLLRTAQGDIPLAENVSAYVLPKNDTILLLTNDGILLSYTISQGLKKQLDTEVSSLSVPYRNGPEGLVFYYEKKDGLYRYADGGRLSLSHLPVSTMPSAMFSAKTDGLVYYYYQEEQVLYGERNGAMELLLDQVSAIFQYDREKDCFLLAADNRLCLATYSGQNKPELEQLVKLGGKYSGDPDFVRQHLAVWTDDFQTIYVSRLTGLSWVWNKWNAGSWMNRHSRFRYHLTVLKKQSGSWESTAIKETDSVILHTGAFLSDVSQDGLFLANGYDQYRQISFLLGLAEEDKAFQFFYSTPRPAGQMLTYVYQEERLYCLSDTAFCLQEETGERKELLHGTFQLFQQRGNLYLIKKTDYGVALYRLKLGALEQLVQEAILE